MKFENWLPFGFVLLLGPSTAWALDPGSSDARAIAKAVEDRNTGDRGTSQATLTLTDKNGRQRVRKVRQTTMNFAEGKKTLIFFESPADVRNTGFLSVDYDDGKKDDDQWLYLPSLHKATRISSADRSGSFMGTDISYADMTKKDLADYEYALIETSAKVDGDDCWVIESRPRTEQEKKETGYLKTQVWVSKQKLMPLQVKSWVLEGKKIKFIKFSDVRQVQGIWVGHSMTVRTVRGTEVESTTTLALANVKFEQAGVTAEQFSERRLEQGL
jgi:outer membrane lipoprotein-sorting protein